MSDRKLTDIAELGEFGLINRLTQNIPLTQKSTVKGVGDDAAVLKNGTKKYTLVSTDLLIEGVHFDMMYTPLKHLGYKAAVVNFSDMAAMNGIPKQIVVGLAVSSKYSLEALEEFYEGIKKACEFYHVDFVGGDTSSSIHGLFISVTVIGEVQKEKIAYRSGAKSGDILCVTGDLGGAYMGLLLLEREKKVFKANPNMQPDMAGKEYILERQLKPEARTDMVKKLAEKQIVPTAMIDISDGLASEALHIAKASAAGIVIYEDRIPIDPVTYDTAQEFSLVPAVAALNGGEDYELLFTVKQADYDKIKEMPDVSVIGYVSDISEGNRLITPDNQVIELTAQGWDALKK
ncbi:thiamine-phosphate kinase [Candidatus Sulfidibacterium hydrothermale]|uniref:thiamine-phosphate kinase n=1 Tax=Candidatus Sulfidibacterium hydrothermale TaxID=2875962 RepID=UPI001F0B4D67|nr:thiamine-phosphate kinase [Candidatus Sulfidibacterium hydrothermale]UBM62963.1 thiamine-phosphate kinase [Candidatus Sulfidibacterium hydrothermale]